MARIFVITFNFNPVLSDQVNILALISFSKPTLRDFIKSPLLTLVDPIPRLAHII